MMRFAAGFMLGALMLLTTACADGYGPEAQRRTPSPRDFALNLAVDPRATDAAAALGKTLFHDARLSGDGSRSCASCHDTARGYGDGQARSQRLSGQPLGRHTPTLYNVGGVARLFWDGRAASLEEQAWGPINNAEEMGGDTAVTVARIASDPNYQRDFATAFGKRSIDAAAIGTALAAYQRTITPAPAPFDRWAAGDASAISPQARRGFALFTGKARCSTCHAGPGFSDGRFHDIGLASSDPGRFAVTRRKRDRHGFRTPGLRELGRTAPYMHDGSKADLRAVIEHYSTGIVTRAGAAPKVTLTAHEKDELEAFLKSLTS